MFDDLLAANAAYTQRFELGHLQAPVRRGLGLVTCIDTRIDPLAILGLEPGDAKIIRNAGGRVTSDALRSLVLATNMLQVTRVVVMHHTGCALVTSAEALTAKVAELTGRPADGWDFHAIEDPDRDLAADVEAVRTCPLIPDSVVVVGWRYDVGTGRVEQVVS